MGKGKVQVEVSRKRLDKLKSDGMELVTNVRVAGDAREMQHRLEDTENRHVRLERLASVMVLKKSLFIALCNNTVVRLPYQYLLFRLLKEKSIYNHM